MKTNKISIWTDPKFKLKNLIKKKINISQIEEELKLLIRTNYEAVLVSSGRVGIIMALIEKKLKREDYIGLFPYASSCVIGAVGHVASPICGNIGASANPIINYHQWGYLNLQNNKNVLIDDAVDSFCLPGCKLMPSGGDFEIWSLNKTLGCLGGGVIWCKNNETANIIRDLRDNRNSFTNIRWIIRWLSIYNPSLVQFWFSQEMYGGAPPGWSLNQIKQSIDNWLNIKEKRYQRINLVKEKLSIKMEFDPLRLPCVIPYKEKDPKKIISLRNQYGINELHFSYKNNIFYENVIPIPVHQDIEIEELKEIIDFLKK